MSKAFDKDGNEIEVYTAEEVTAKVTEETGKVKAEFEPKIATLETELTGARTALNARAGEFAQFRKLSEEQIQKLDEKDRIIYENGLALQQERERNSEQDKKVKEAAVDAAIRAKAGSDEKLFTRMKEMWGIIGVEAVTAEEIENKTKMVLGAISTTQPDLVASVAGFTGGGFKPPESGGGEKKSFADTEKGQGLMKEIGLKLPEAKK